MKATANARQLIDIDLPWLLTKASLDEALEFYEWLEEECIRTNDWSPYAALGRGDRYFLILRILNRTDVVHPGKRGDWLYARCREVENDPDGWLDLWSREHYKSSFITFAGSIQTVLNDPEITIGIFSHTRPAAKSFLSQIAREMEQNEKLKVLYPDVLWANPRKEAAKWSLDEGIVVKRKGNPKEQSIEAWGLVDGQPTGKHFRLMIFDDVVTKESVTTPDQIIKATKAWELAQHLGIQKGGRSWHIGTRYAFQDTYAQLLEREAVKPRVHPATEDGTFDGKPVFLTDDEWARKKKESSLETIAAQMLLNPSAGSLQELRPEWLRPYELRPETLNVYIMGDYAGSRKSTGSSNTALVVIGVDANLNKYLLDGAVHKMDLDERWIRIRDLRKKWLRQKGIQIVDVGYERFGAQSDIEHFETMMRIEGESFSIKELAWPSEGSVSKDNRIRRLIPDLKNWRFFFPYANVRDKYLAESKKKELIDEEDEEIEDHGHYGEPTVAQVRAKNEGQAHLIAQPIKQKNHEGKLYDVIDWFVRNEYLFFPNTTQKDFLDAMSRIYDMSINPPMIYDERVLCPEQFED